MATNNIVITPSGRRIGIYRNDVPGGGCPGGWVETYNPDTQTRIASHYTVGLLSDVEIAILAEQEIIDNRE